MIFIDTGAFLARYLEGDQRHQEARAGWERLATGSRRCFTSSFVLDETLTLLGRRASFAFAAGRGRKILASREVLILRPDEEDELRALDLLEKFADQKVSFTDCTSFALMRRHGIQRVFAFDRHFLHAGFRLWPEAGEASWVFDGD